jgi:hypothetical protein
VSGVTVHPAQGVTTLTAVLAPRYSMGDRTGAGGERQAAPGD